MSPLVYEHIKRSFEQLYYFFDTTHVNNQSNVKPVKGITHMRQLLYKSHLAFLSKVVQFVNLILFVHLHVTDNMSVMGCQL